MGHDPRPILDKDDIIALSIHGLRKFLIGCRICALTVEHQAAVAELSARFRQFSSPSSQILTPNNFSAC